MEREMSTKQSSATRQAKVNNAETATGLGQKERPTLNERIGLPLVFAGLVVAWAATFWWYAEGPGVVKAEEARAKEAIVAAFLKERDCVLAAVRPQAEYRCALPERTYIQEGRELRAMALEWQRSKDGQASASK